MDQGTMVKSGQDLVRYLDETPVNPRFAMWVNFSEAESWKLWIVPAKSITDKRAFYHTVADTISKHRDDLGGLDVGMVEFTADTKSVVRSMAKFMKMPNIGAANVSGNTFDGMFLPDGVLIRSNIAA
ncbi:MULTISPECIES: hypothetical protein [Rhizobium]|uniref:Uncharacterized protein n=1 Tax=Rhizobium rhododendri TaxID=2506430 RepID=A0ABY8ILL9_9HYPH|nr:MULTISPECIES: hypothetical protein [Rhizobium]MBZ5758385.1 hypothetical protein [Rhizobium sp. VS19-DR96]MBZ5764785.1 hypothetical protein [Rhizobium sp. VS19-DR129.2]MBZ5772328.1 hypothetical protein [Rhizobium sp. VS19-DRK62.2]MBZ5782985.1 hypothetical protein [Rhizobium sp. VS19-DR121]MBZ5800433.1 hypothetical protein [Rhizobium sp. VS19-DR181]